MKHLTRWGLAALLLLLCALPAMAFSDTEDLDELELAAVAALNDMGVIEGYPDGTFRPDEPLTRAEFAKMLCLFAAQDELAPTETAFVDVAADAWYASWVGRASQMEWINGYPGGEFRPQAHISQQELAAVLLRLSGRDTAGLGWPDEYIAAAEEEGLLNGIEFYGPSKASRLLTCRMFYNLLPQSEEAEADANASATDGLYLGVVENVVKGESGTDISFYNTDKTLPAVATMRRLPTEGSFIYYTLKDGVIDDWHLLLDAAKDYVAPTTPLTRLTVPSGPYSWALHQSGKEVESPVELKSVKPLVQYISYRNLTVGQSRTDSRNYWLDDATLFFDINGDGLMQPGSRDSLQLNKPVTVLVDTNGTAVYVFCYVE